MVPTSVPAPAPVPVPASAPINVPVPINASIITDQMQPRLETAMYTHSGYPQRNG